MKTRIASSIALAAAILLGASGCGLFAPQSTTDQYEPSDGIDVNIADISVRNLMLIAAEDGEHFNVVFSAVNPGDSAVQLKIDFVDEEGSAKASANFAIEPGSQLFGDPDGDIEPVLVPLTNVVAGQTVTFYFQIPGSTDVKRQVPVLDGTLVEYQPFVLSTPMLVVPDEAAEEGEPLADEENAEEAAE